METEGAGAEGRPGGEEGALGGMEEKVWAEEGSLEEPEEKVMDKEDPGEKVEDKEDPEEEVDDTQGRLEDQEEKVETKEGSLEDQEETEEDKEDPEEKVDDTQGRLEDPEEKVDDTQGRLEDPEEKVDDTQGRLEDQEEKVENKEGNLEDQEEDKEDPEEKVEDKEGELECETNSLMKLENEEMKCISVTMDTSDERQEGGIGDGPEETEGVETWERETRGQEAVNALGVKDGVLQQGNDNYSGDENMKQETTGSVKDEGTGRVADGIVGTECQSSVLDDDISYCMGDNHAPQNDRLLNGNNGSDKDFGEMDNNGFSVPARDINSMSNGKSDQTHEYIAQNMSVVTESGREEIRGCAENEKSVCAENYSYRGTQMENIENAYDMNLDNKQEAVEGTERGDLDLEIDVNGRDGQYADFDNDRAIGRGHEWEDETPVPTACQHEGCILTEEPCECLVNATREYDEGFTEPRHLWNGDAERTHCSYDDPGMTGRGADDEHGDVAMVTGLPEEDNGIGAEEINDLIEGDYEYDEELVEFIDGQYAYYDETGIIEGDYEYDEIFEGLTGGGDEHYNEKISQPSSDFAEEPRASALRRFSFSAAETSSMASILWVPAAFLTFSGILYWLSTHLPALDEQHKMQLNNTSIEFPSNLEELQSLATLLSVYKTTHFSYVLLLFSTAYIFKQTFAIPGSVFMNLLGGALFGQWLGFLLACVLSASGATCCFILAKLCGKEYIVKYFPHYLKTIQQKIEENLDSLFFFLLFLRLFPMTPNWFLNMASPICGIPIHLFFFSVLLGLMPYNFLCVQTGCFLSQLTSMDNIFTWWTILKLFGVANGALLPGILIKHYHDQRQQRKQKAKES